MQDVGVIDRFLAIFTQYIDSGFGLLGGEVSFLASTLIAIDVTLAALFWAWGADSDIMQRLVKKTLFAGVFAWLIGNWNALAKIIFNSFAGLGIKATGTGFSAQDLLRPGKIAQVGLDAAHPLLDAIGPMLGPIAFFENFIQILALSFAWIVVLLAFFILAIQLFVTLIEFKLTTLAGFVLIPFGLFGKTAFLAERVVGNVFSSGVKVLVLAIVTGIGSTLFSQFTTGFGANLPTVDDAMAIVLAALSLLALGIFGPGIANGLISGGPQLGAGAAAGTALAAGGAIAAGGAALGVAGRGGAALAGGAASAARAGASVAGGATTAYTLGSAGKSGAGAAAGGLAGVAKAGGAAAVSPLKRAAQNLQTRFNEAGRATFSNTGGASSQGSLARPQPQGEGAVSAPSAASASDQFRQARRGSSGLGHSATAAAHTLRAGDSHGGGASVDLKEDKS